MGDALVIDIIVVSELAALVTANFALRAYARRRLVETLPVFFPVRAAMLVAIALTFAVSMLVAAIAGHEVVYEYPRWQTLVYVFMLGSTPPLPRRHVVIYAQATLLALALPVANSVVIALSDDASVVREVTGLAKCVLAMALYYFVYARMSYAYGYAYGIALTVVVICEAVGYEQGAALFIWTGVPLLVASCCLYEVYEVRRQFSVHSSYIDFSVVRAVDLRDSHPSTVLFEVASLVSSRYANAHLLGCHGFTVLLPRFCLAMERGLWSLSALRRMLATAERPKLVTAIYLSGCARAVQAIHTIDSSLSNAAIRPELDDFVLCRDGVKLRRPHSQRSDARPTLSHYTAPEVYSGGEIDAQAGDVYALGVVFWELLHPEDIFSIRWAGDAARVGGLGDVPEGLRDLVLKMLARRGRPSSDAVVAELDRIVYTSFSELLDELDVEHSISGRALVRALIAHKVTMNDVEARILCQNLLGQIIIRPTRSDPEEFSFDRDEFEFSIANSYSVLAPGDHQRNTLPSPSCASSPWGDEYTAAIEL